MSCRVVVAVQPSRGHATHRPRRRSVLAAAGGPAPSTASTTTTRRSADVAVLGSSLQAYAAAYLLAKKGKRTVVIEHSALELVPRGGGARQRDIILHLPATTPHLVNEATEALALWRGVEAAADARGLLQLCGSVDIAPIKGSSAASDTLGAMQDACRAAGLQFGMRSAEELSAAYPRLRPPRNSASLYTPLGGVVQGRLAAAVLHAMAARAGADVAPAGRARCLLGWRDVGGHFALRCGTAAAAVAGAGARVGAPPRGAQGDEVVWEVEQLVLLPEAAVQESSLAAFGLAVPGARAQHAPAGRWRAQEDCAALPVWQLLGMGSSQREDDPTAAVDSCWGTPVLDWAPGGILVAQSLADGQFETAAAAGPGTQAPGEPEGAANPDLAGAVLAQQFVGAGQLEAAVAAAAAAAAAGMEERPESEEAVERQLKRLAEVQRQREAAQRRLGSAGGLAGQLLYGMGAQLAPPAGIHLQLITTPDGESAAGSHPGFEQGRVVAAFPATAAALGCLPGDQLALLVARLAVAEVLGQPPEAVNAGLVALTREALAAEARPLGADSWSELSRVLQPPAEQGA